MSEVNNAPGTVPASLPETTDVLIVGGGPVGSAMAAELRLRGVRCLIVEKETEIPDTPVRAMYLNMRTLEHFRRWGIDDQLRIAATTPREWQFDVTFCTSLTGRELGLYRALAYRESEVGDVAAEPAQSVMQYVANRVLRDRAGELGAGVATGWDCTSITQTADGVVVEVVGVHNAEKRTVRARYAVGCDGARSLVRQAAQIERLGRGGLGMYMLIHWRAPRLRQTLTIGPAAFILVFNPDTRGLIHRIDENRWTVHIPGFAPDADISGFDVHGAVREYIGSDDIDFEITYAGPYKFHELIAETYRNGNLFLAGDAAHLYPPFGGHNMNSGFDDAVNLGWKLAAELQGWGGEGLLDSYTAERRPIALRNATEATRNAKQFALAAKEVGGSMSWEVLNATEPDAEARRRAYGEQLYQTTFRNWVNDGIVLDQRYQQSPVIVDDRSAEPEWDPARYIPFAKPGHRAPHARTADGNSLYDSLGLGYTLLAFDHAKPRDVEAIVEAAEARHMPLNVLRLDDRDIAELYDDPLVLIRPDQHVAWRGATAPDDPSALVDILCGAGDATQDTSCEVALSR